MPSLQDAYYIYMVQSSSRRALYVGVTNNLERRIAGHKSGSIEGFTADYRCCRLVYYESFADIRDAIAREKQLKGWRREKKNWLVEKANPIWCDLSADWGKPIERPKWALRDPFEKQPS